MQYKVYDSDDKLHGTFETISDLELYMDGVRNSRGDRYKELPKHSAFDYIKSIGWFMEVVDTHDQNTS